MPQWRARRAANHPRATRKEHPRRIHEAKHTKKEEKKKRRKEANAGTVVSRQARRVVQRGGTREHGTTETLPNRTLRMAQHYTACSDPPDLDGEVEDLVELP